MNFLKEILEDTNQAIENSKKIVSLHDLRAKLDKDLSEPGFAKKIAQPGIHLIAEVKKASPSAGIIRQDFDCCSIARDYESGGASCISVLTEEKHFLGSLSYLESIRKAVSLPLLRKDFIIDEYQIYEAKLCGADAILLISAILKKDDIDKLIAVAKSVKLDVILEIHDLIELERVFDFGADIIGLNSRNLTDFSVDLNIIPQLFKNMPKECLTICESGVRNLDDLKFVKALGINAVLVGEALMRSRDIVQTTKTFTDFLKQ